MHTQPLHSPHSDSTIELQRRHALQTLFGGFAASLLPRVWAQSAPVGDTPKSSSGPGRVIVVFLRGAYDGLSAFVPYADRDYYAIRPNIALPAPDGTAQTALKLDDSFAMHPALLPLLPLWQQGVLSFVPCAGLPSPNRSHFDAQYQMEIASPGKVRAASGWLNSLASQASNVSPPVASALGVGEANPAILAGHAPVKLIARGQAAERTGVLANDGTRQALLDLYSGSDPVSQAFRQGAGSRIQSAQELSTEKVAIQRRRELAANQTKRNMEPGLDRDGSQGKSPQAVMAQMQAANNGAADPVGLQLDAQHLGTLMRNERNLRIGFLSAGGWDTHANQGAVTGQLANNLGQLANSLAQLRQDFSEPGDVIVVMSEFGRTSAENGTRGTDHGFGNAMWLIGNRVNGGRWHGQWTGLAKANLNENRDLPAHHDFRAVIAQALRASFQMQDTQLGQVLPGMVWDNQLNTLFAKT
jgi:uncharacterized protein (DUF1501 family)